MGKSCILAICVPCYNEEAVLEDSATKLMLLLNSLKKEGIVSPESFILFSNDGSSDRTWDIISTLHSQDNSFCGISLSANFGFQSNLMAAITEARKMADYIVTIDADLQDDYKLIPQMLEYCVKDGCDVVYGVRKDRSTDSRFKRVTATTFYKFMAWMNVKTIYNHADFRLMSRRYVQALEEYPERNLYIRGIVSRMGYPSASVYYDRTERQAGETKFTLAKMVSLAVDGITSFSIKPMRLLLLTGLCFIVFAFCMLLYVLFSLKGASASGWPSLMLSLWFIGGVLLVGLGIMGEYIGKIYLETKGRPRYHISRKLLKDDDH